MTIPEPGDQDPDDLLSFLIHDEAISMAYLAFVGQAPELKTMMDSFMAMEAVHAAEYARVRSTLPDTRQGVEQLKQQAALQALWESQHGN